MKPSVAEPRAKPDFEAALPSGQVAPWVSVTRRATFCAAHHYWRDGWSEDENQRAFSACSNRWGHGHNYVLWLTVLGPVDPETGMVVNLKDLKRLIQSHVVDVLDHQHLNHQVPAFQSRIPTLENLASWIAEAVTPPLAAIGLRVHRLVLEENETLSVTWQAD